MSYYSNMRKFLILFFVLFLTQRVYAFDVVYPKKTNVSVNSPTTFFIGASTEPLTINGENVELHRTGAFAYFVNLSNGKNTFELKTETETKVYTVTRPIVKPKKMIKAKFIPLTQSTYIVKKDNTPLRSSPANGGLNRITNLPKGVSVQVDGKLGGFYRIVLDNNKKGWIYAENIGLISNKKTFASISGYDFLEVDDYFAYIFHIDNQVPYEISVGDVSQLTFYNVKDSENGQYIFKFPYKEAAGTSKTLGYIAQYDGNDFIWKIRKFPEINKRNPLKDIVIAVDAGHGGNELGAIGCLGDKEKDVVLNISLYLKEELESRGAKVVMTRDSDEQISLDDRVKIANDNDSMIFLSIHGNALPDTMDPNKHRGTSVYYYNPESKLLGANVLYSMVDKLGLPNDKLRQQSFAVIRNHQALSLLIEIGYLINPYDNELLIDEKFQKRCAKAIADGVEDYLKSE